MSGYYYIFRHNNVLQDILKEFDVREMQNKYSFHICTISSLSTGGDPF